MAYVSMADLGQGSRQDSFWSWFFTGIGPRPKKAYKEVAFKQQQGGAAQKANKAWGGMEYEAKAEEDLNPFEAQGYDAAQALGVLADVSQWGVGLGDDPPPAAPAPAPPPVAATASRAPFVIAASLIVGGTGALIYGAMSAKPEPAVRSNKKRRNG